MQVRHRFQARDRYPLPRDNNSLTTVHLSHEAQEFSGCHVNINLHHGLFPLIADGGEAVGRCLADILIPTQNSRAGCGGDGGVRPPA